MLESYFCTETLESPGSVGHPLCWDTVTPGHSRENNWFCWKNSTYSLQ